ncbi:hypothetical protein ACIOK4_00080 [Streptomyces bottropensis]|uniref:hypothetical protein n=1 Tax=Streptomyces bottropensis TaxID=42235 RepID=UPI003824D2EA
MDRTLLDSYITAWLARAHDDPEQVRAEWADRGVALLPLGRAFSAVRLTSRLVHAAVGSHDPAVITAELEDRLSGPVIHDSLAIGKPYYALIQWHAGVVWKGDDETPCLGDGVHLGVPRIERVRPPGTYWLVPPRREDGLCRSEAVQQLIQDGRAALDAETAETAL